MSSESNLRDIHLLNSNPRQLVAEVQNLVDIVLASFIKRKLLSQFDREDVKQSLNEKLIKKLPLVKKNFNGSTQLRTYLTVVIRNIGMDIIEADKKLGSQSISEDHIILSEELVLSNILVEQEVERLINALVLFGRKRHKLELCLKLKFRFPVDISDFKQVYNTLDEHAFNVFFNQVGSYEETTDDNLYKALTELINEFEKKNNRPDAIRKWIKSHTDELIKVLNGNPPVSSHNEETLQLLFEKYSLIRNRVSVKAG